MALSSKQIPILEQFVSIQGEGLNVGVPYVFIRVGGCPLRCRFCDSEYTWKFNKDMIQSVYDVADQAVGAATRHGINWISITGGEPLLYPGQILNMISCWMLSSIRLKIHIETSGRFFHHGVFSACDLWSMDIKTPCTNEVNEDDLRYLGHMRPQY